MPEIGEVARIVHYLKKHLVGKTIATIKTHEDDIVYGKVGCSASAFQKAMTGKKVVDARQQGKYFWLVMSSPPHPLMHLGMTGWLKFSNDETSYYKPTKVEDQAWPPKFWKFTLKTKEDPDCEVAFVDARRLGRIRLVEADGEKMRTTTPLKENGPDPVIDSDILTQEWLAKKLRSKKVPVKALLLDQANISGVGNWVGDEVLYQAKLHPEQYSNTFSDAQIKQLHDSLIQVCTIAVETLADSSKFPEDWLMRHRWGKGKEGGGRLPNGDKIIFLKVGGRTSAVVPSVQKKTGPVAADVSKDANDIEEGEEDDEVKKPKKTTRQRGNIVANARAKTKSLEVTTLSKTPKRGRKKSQQEKVEEEDEEEDEEDEEDSEDEAEEPPAKKKQKGAINTEGRNGMQHKGKKTEKPEPKSTPVKKENTQGRRRSARMSNA